MRDTTQVPQPVAPAPELISGYPSIPEKLAQIDPTFRQYHRDLEQRYRRLREAFAESHYQISLPVTQAKLASDSLKRQQTTLATELATEQAYSRSLAETITQVEDSVDAVSGALSTQASRITTLESTVAGGTTDLTEVWSRITAIENTYATETEAGAIAQSSIATALGSGGNIKAAVDAEASARITADGWMAGKYTLAVTAGNVVTGMNVTSTSGPGTSTSEITFQAGVFKVFNGATAEAPFEVVGNAVKMAGTKIKDGTITAAQIAAGTITTAQLNFAPVQTNGVVASVNASAEGVRISGNKITIDGNVTFAGGYNPMTKVASGGAAADVNANATTISGGKITAGSVTASQMSSVLSFVQELILTSGGSLHSANYVAAVSGFKIDYSGNAEFNQITLRNPILYNTLPTPSLSPGSGSFTGSLAVSASGPVGATLRYSTTGSVTAASPVWPGTLTLTSSTTVRLRAFLGTAQSDEVTGTYTSTSVVQKVSTPFITGANGWNPVTVYLSCSTAGATIYVSINGSAWYSATQANVYPGQTVEFYAARSGWTSSDIGYYTA